MQLVYYSGGLVVELILPLSTQYAGPPYIGHTLLPPSLSAHR